MFINIQDHKKREALLPQIRKYERQIGRLRDSLTAAKIIGNMAKITATVSGGYATIATITNSSSIREIVGYAGLAVVSTLVGVAAKKHKNSLQNTIDDLVPTYAKLRQDYFAGGPLIIHKKTGVTLGYNTANGPTMYKKPVDNTTPPPLLELLKA
ncbi:hypothetical protein BVX95_01350 [archaeon D22]|nr:hypothetical protein BVX95_01350 [archaeon D22]